MKLKRLQVKLAAFFIWQVTSLNPVFLYEPKFDGLCQKHITNKGDYYKDPVHGRQGSKAQSWGKRRIRKINTYEHNQYSSDAEGPACTTLKEGDFVRSNNVNDKRLSQ